jgi:hypothetical protein
LHAARSYLAKAEHPVAGQPARNAPQYKSPADPYPERDECRIHHSTVKNFREQFLTVRSNGPKIICNEWQI